MRGSKETRERVYLCDRAFHLTSFAVGKKLVRAFEMHSLSTQTGARPRAVAAGELIFRFILVRSNLQSIRAAPPWQRNAKNETRRFLRSTSQPESKEYFVKAVLVCTSQYTPFLVRYIFMNVARSKSRSHSCCSARRHSLLALEAEAAIHILNWK